MREWWRYLRLRLYWRRLCRWFDIQSCPRVIIGKQEYYLVGWGYEYDIGRYTRLYIKYPGVCMTKTEYEHWFRVKIT